MTIDPLVINELTTMDKVALIFDKRQIHHVPVLNEEGTCTGIISMNDFLQIQDKFSIFNIKSSTKINDKVLPSLLAREVMSKEPTTIDENDSIETAIHIFLANVFRALIVTSQGKMIGIVTPYDILKQLAQPKLVEA